MANRLYFILCLLVSIITEGSGLKCFVCQSVNEPQCGDLFLVTPGDAALQALCPTSCFKFVAAIDERSVLSRGCLPELKTPERCQFDNVRGIHGTMCTCNSDYCNVTSGIHKVAVWFIFVSTIVSLVSKY